jgi:hypothetical protein
MPNIYSYFGIIFKFYSNDHEPLHVHAICGEYETIFDIVFSQGKFLELKRRKNAEKTIYPQLKWNWPKSLLKNMRSVFPRNGTSSLS